MNLRSVFKKKNKKSGKTPATSKTPKKKTAKSHSINKNKPSNSGKGFILCAVLIAGLFIAGIFLIISWALQPKTSKAVVSGNSKSQTTLSGEYRNVYGKSVYDPVCIIRYEDGCLGAICTEYDWDNKKVESITRYKFNKAIGFVNRRSRVLYSDATNDDSIVYVGLFERTPAIGEYIIDTDRSTGKGFVAVLSSEVTESDEYSTDGNMYPVVKGRKMNLEEISTNTWEMTPEDFALADKSVFEIDEINSGETFDRKYSPDPLLKAQNFTTGNDGKRITDTLMVQIDDIVLDMSTGLSMSKCKDMFVRPGTSYGAFLIYGDTIENYYDNYPVTPGDICKLLVTKKGEGYALLTCANLSGAISGAGDTSLIQIEPAPGEYMNEREEVSENMAMDTDTSGKINEECAKNSFISGGNNMTGTGFNKNTVWDWCEALGFNDDSDQALYTEYGNGTGIYSVKYGMKDTERQDGSMTNALTEYHMDQTGSCKMISAGIDVGLEH